MIGAKSRMHPERLFEGIDGLRRDRRILRSGRARQRHADQGERGGQRTLDHRIPFDGSLNNRAAERGTQIISIIAS